MIAGEVRAAYGRRAAEYIDQLGTMESTALQDRALIGTWADGIRGRVLDVGCGPGQWAHWLHEQGCDVEGVDPVPEFIDAARRRFPDVPFRVDQAAHLDIADESVTGVLAWYSLIHLEPDDVAEVLAEFARVLSPGGTLALGFFEGPEVEVFDHAVAPAYFWPIDRLTRQVEDAGFTVTARETRTDPGARRHGAILARRDDSTAT